MTGALSLGMAVIDALCLVCQVCGARGGGDGAAQGMFLALNSQHVFMLALETPFKRNVCIGLIRKVSPDSVYVGRLLFLHITS